MCIMFREVKSSIYQKSFKSDWFPLRNSEDLKNFRDFRGFMDFDGFKEI